MLSVFVGRSMALIRKVLLMNRYVVCDEDGELRSFPTKGEAEKFCAEYVDEFTIKVKPKKRKPDPLELVGECLI
jgi:hypothetical protein